VTKARACEGAGQVWRSIVTFHAHGSMEKCEGMNLHTPKWVPTPTLGVRVPMDFWIFREWLHRSKPIGLGVPYIIGKFLEHKCLKWTRITHLDTSNTSYGQKKGWESNWQFDSQPLKVKNHPDFLACRWHATYHWKALDEGYKFALYLISIRGLHAKLWAPKVVEVPTLGISGLSLGSPGTKWHLVLAMWPST
jgi:hypothetical protein